MSEPHPTSVSNTLRTPIVAVLGHVDHGKTSLLDRIRGSAVIEGEPGAITQHIGATEVPLDIISDLAGELVDPEAIDLPGLLFIDTPGHHSFQTLRARGGALADLAILVVDINDGCQPQTYEALDILRRSETPFVVAANKVDTIPGWSSEPDQPIMERYDAQSDRTRRRLDEALFALIGELGEEGFSSDRYWQLQDFQRTIGVVPVSAETGEGIPDLLTVLMGLAQRYMREEMAVDVTGPGAGTVLEVSEERGFGTTVDVVLYDGRIVEGDTIVVGAMEEPIVTEVRALLKHRTLAEIRTDGAFERVAQLGAATGVKIVAPQLEDAMAGAPVRVVGARDRAMVVAEVEDALSAFDVETSDEGVVLKADTLGSLEAMSNALSELDIPILRAEVGDIAPRDLSIASTIDELRHRVILGFNVSILPEAEAEAEESEVRLFVHDIIYRLVEEYEEYVETLEAEQHETILEKIIRPARFTILVDHVFRQSNPAVVGVEIEGGTLRRNVPVVQFDGANPRRVGELKGIQDAGEDVSEARVTDRVSVAIDGPTVGRQIDEGDELWVELPETHAKILEQELNEDIPPDERDTLRMYLERKRRTDPFWAK